MSVLPSICYPVGDASPSNKGWSVICETIDAAGQKTRQGPVNMFAPTENEANRKAQSHFKSRGALSVKIVSSMPLG